MTDERKNNEVENLVVRDRFSIDDPDKNILFVDIRRTFRRHPEYCVRAVMADWSGYSDEWIQILNVDRVIAVAEELRTYIVVTADLPLLSWSDPAQIMFYPNWELHPETPIFEARRRAHARDLFSVRNYQPRFDFHSHNGRPVVIKGGRT